MDNTVLLVRSEAKHSNRRRPSRQRRRSARSVRSRSFHPPMHPLIALIALSQITAILVGVGSSEESSESSNNSYQSSSSHHTRLKPTESNNGNKIRKKPFLTSQTSPEHVGSSYRGINMKRDRSNEHQKDDFLDWCRSALGIETILEIQTFEYYDYLQDILTENSLDEWDATTDDDNYEKALSSPPPLIPVRGLAASRHISVGETVIRIPLHGLLSVKTTIDEDPFLSPLMGPDARQKYGWNIVPSPPENDEEIAFLFELSLLAVAILYHRSLSSESPLAPYIQILEGSIVDSMPFLWSRDKLQTTSLPAGIRDVAMGIRRDIRDMYKTVVQVLAEQHPEVFGNASKTGRDDEWMFSYGNFQWAFAVVNSRHWQLPIEDLSEEEEESSSPTDILTPQTAPKLQAVVEDQVPPADMPTEAWVQVQEEIDDVHAEPASGGKGRQVNFLLEHSFLAPVADLLNFGPSCTQGRYDSKTHTFEIVASCPYRKGQEVTFWYSDECVDIIVGMYGFSHPMIPHCLTLEESQLQQEVWRQRAEAAEKQLEQAFKELDEVHDELDFAQEILEQCSDCCVYDRPSSRSRTRSSSRISRDASSGQRSEHNVRGARSSRQNEGDRHHGVRRMRMIYSRRSEF